MSKDTINEQVEQHGTLQGDYSLAIKAIRPLSLTPGTEIKVTDKKIYLRFPEE